MITFQDSFAKSLGLRFEADAVWLTIRPDLINDGGMFLGPVSFALVDYAMTAELLRVKTAEERIATTHIAINFLASASEGQVCCRATLDRRARRVAFLSAQVEHADGRLLATAIGTFAISW
jgi:uncharacterized protein (TIGR00369 family)